MLDLAPTLGAPAQTVTIGHALAVLREARDTALLSQSLHVPAIVAGALSGV